MGSKPTVKWNLARNKINQIYYADGIHALNKHTLSKIEYLLQQWHNKCELHAKETVLHTVFVWNGWMKMHVIQCWLKPTVNDAHLDTTLITCEMFALSPPPP